MSGPAQTWEYRTVEGDLSEAALAALGREGWELVGSGPGEHGRLYFKRPGLDFRERVTLDQKRRYYALWGLPVAEEGGQG